ncbi:MAG TPA: type II toxin-antitoxin system death-on-curing family toxin [Azonexus sp.]|nr:type II toxin-antitoxin system death-on-curing family toxin [Azonexus sp.]
MSRWTWIEESVVWAVHEAQLAEHGGLAGVRDADLLASALARPLNQAAYGEPDAATLAAAYGFGIARNRPFIDGNKRTAFVCCELFLVLNGYLLLAEDAICVSTMLALAAGELSEPELADRLRTHSAPA